MRNTDKTLDIIAGVMLDSHHIVMRANVTVPQGTDMGALHREKGFTFLSINNVPSVSMETVGRITNLTPDMRHLSLNYRPGDTRGLRGLMVNALGDLIKECACRTHL